METLEVTVEPVEQLVEREAQVARRAPAAKLTREGLRDLPASRPGSFTIKLIMRSPAP